LYKLQYYGVRGVVYDWFKNYLSGRFQYVSVTGINSELTVVTFGVPQGSALFLFHIYCLLLNWQFSTD